jgi:very-short-patch-repair endonuclease
VDELPDVLFFNLNNSQKMRFLPLPAIDDDPFDEQSATFIQAAANARLTDPDYGEALDKLDSSNEDYLDKSRKLERDLKDKVRLQLNLPPRPEKKDTNLVQHARNNGITPSYDLPQATENERSVFHADENIQTLFLPKDLERKLSALISKCNTWIQETGINVLHASFGFLEYKETSATEPSFAPLILLPVKIEKNKTKEGIEFWVRGLGEEAEVNTVLSEKLRLEFGIQLPPLEGGSVEAYLQAVSDISPKTLSWRVRRQVAFGVFPSARIAMYHDLDTGAASFASSEVLAPLFGGSDPTGTSPFADEYLVDHPDLERKVPYLVMDADASQFSTLIDIASGKNVAVEGPPGTGKSQTIVNAIAAAMASGKKVLFVSEKTAALDVVRSRLESIGLGEFLLPLLAERSTRESVIASIRERLEMEPVARPQNFEQRVADFRKARDETAHYIKILTTNFQDTGLTVYEIIGKSIATATVLDKLPKELQLLQLPISSGLTETAIREKIEQAEKLCQALRKAASYSPLWEGIRQNNLNRFDIDEILSLTKNLSQDLEEIGEKLSSLSDAGLRSFDPLKNSSQIKEALRAAVELANDDDAAIAADVAQRRASCRILEFLNGCQNHRNKSTELQKIFNGNLSEEILDSIKELEEICGRQKLTAFDDTALIQEAEDSETVARRMRALSARVRLFADMVPGSEDWPLGYFEKIREIVDNAGQDTIYFRSDALADPAARILLKKYNKIGFELASTKSDFSEQLSTDIDISIDQLQQCAAAFQAVGFLGPFSSEYRRAKTIFLRISKTKFDRSSALSILDRYIAWKRREMEFLGDATVTSLYGTRFRGLETDFELFDRLISYYEQLQKAFPAIDQKSVRDFLLTGAADKILQAPELEVYSELLSLKEIDERIGGIDDETAQLRQDSARIRKLKNIFVSSSSIEVDSLPELKRQLCSFIEEENRLNSDAEAAIILGNYFSGAITNTASLQPVLSVARKLEETGDSLDDCCSVISSRNSLNVLECLSAIEAKHASWHRNEAELKSRTRLDPKSLLLEGSFGDRAKLLATASIERDSLFSYAEVARARECVDLTIQDVIQKYLTLTGIYDGIGETLEALEYRSLARCVFEYHGSVLSKFSGNKLTDLRRHVSELDKEIIASSRRLLRAHLHASAKPPGGNGVGRKSSYTDMALIESETSKKQRFIPVRDLTRRAAGALLEIKPCWMMSPLAVAQYLPKGGFGFDLCIIDEASQMTPEDAVGALARSRQAMIVGDTNQLPPSNFFKKLIEDEDADEDETVLNESILEMANSVFRPARRLRWHYRSRHSGLIRFSNRLVYNDDLVVFPSATESVLGMGVEFRSVNGLYKAGTNPIEAQSIVEAALRFMNEHPHRSLGIVTLNQKQRDLIFEEMEHALTKDSGAARYIEEWSTKNEGLEQFFIKNLENVQGDERDVIFIGTVYGPESYGARVMQRFGPINGLAGKRRLNVLFSRAKQLIVTFSSINASDIVAEASSNEGAYMLKCWLEYAATGTLEGGVTQQKEPDSDFEVFVMKQIESMGCKPVPQVGVRGYSIDIGVKHPNWQHGFILGVECDGATFHSSKSARDRDRLRQEILEGLGWKIHRIWSTDWFNNPNEQGAILRRVIDERMIELKEKEKYFTAAIVSEGQSASVTQSPSRKSAPTPKRNGSEQPSSLFDVEASQQDSARPKRSETRRVMVGDTVRVRYLSDDKRVAQFMISEEASDPGKGIVNYKMPIAEALLDAEEGDEVEILVGSYLRPARLERC